MSYVVYAQRLSEPETLSQYLEPLPHVKSLQYSSHSIQVQLIRGRYFILHYLTFLTVWFVFFPFMTAVCLFMEAKYQRFWFGVGSSGLS